MVAFLSIYFCPRIQFKTSGALFNINFSLYIAKTLDRAVHKISKLSACRVTDMAEKFLQLFLNIFLCLCVFEITCATILLT